MVWLWLIPLCLSDADVQAVAGGEKWTLHRLPSPVNTQSESGRQLDMADIVAMPDHSIWGRNGPDVLVFANGRTVTHNLPVETFQGVLPVPTGAAVCGYLDCNSTWWRTASSKCSGPPVRRCTT